MNDLYQLYFQKKSSAQITQKCMKNSDAVMKIIFKNHLHSS